MSDYLHNILSSRYNPVNLRQRSRHTKAIVALAAVCFFWGTTWIASKEGVRHMPAIQLAGIRQLLGGTAYLLFFIVQGKVAWPRGREWVTILVLSFLNFMLTNGLSTWGVKYTSAGLGSIISAIFPLWLVIIGLFTNAEKLPRKAIYGLVLGFAGICIVFFEHLHDFLNSDFSFGIALLLAATWSWAFGTLYTKEHAKTFNPYFGIGLQMFISGIFLYGIAGFSGFTIPLAEIPWQSWTSIGYLVVFGS
ncbi:MAG: EamA family transporter, partial [Gemmatimonadaceae bacterium]|nr:EamA family transporter [Chitinophagaceae bacterium]